MFLKGTCLNNKDNTPKMHNKTRRNITHHEPKGRSPTYQANQGLARWRKKPKTQSKPSPNGIKPCRTHSEAQRRQPIELGSFGPSWGVATPLVHLHHQWGLLGPSFMGFLSMPYVHRFWWFRPGSTYLDGSFEVGLHIYERKYAMGSFPPLHL